MLGLLGDRCADWWAESRHRWRITSAATVSRIYGIFRSVRSRFGPAAFQPSDSAALLFIGHVSVVQGRSCRVWESLAETFWSDPMPPLELSGTEEHLTSKMSSICSEKTIYEITVSPHTYRRHTLNKIVILTFSWYVPD